MSLKGVALVLSVVIVLPTITVAESSQEQKLVVAARPQHVPGERWIYRRDGKRHEIEFVRYEGDVNITRRITEGERTELWYSSADLNPIKVVTEDGEVIRQYQGEYLLYQFPLELGKSWTSNYVSLGNVVRRVTGRVVAYEEVKVPAGVFWAFRIEIENQRTDRRLPATEILWYSLAVKRFVKYYSREFRRELELLEYIPSSR